MYRFHISILSLSLATLASGCLDSVEPPPPSPQANISFPNRIYLTGENSANTCERLFTVTATSVDDPIGIIAPVDGETGGAILNQIDLPHNCFAEVDNASITSPELFVDVHEVTNLQYQLCFDSGACRAPDPSEVTEGDVCSSEDDFDDCPVVSITQAQAADYCEWVGRRLPSGLEAVMIRQAGLTTDANNFPTEAVPLLPLSQGADQIPMDCSTSVLGNGSCDRPFPVIQSNGDLGSAIGDTLTPLANRGQGTIFDLVGNVSEYLADLTPDNRGTAAGLPWFCIGDLPNQPFSAGNPPTCPAGQSCIRGRYVPGPGLELRSDWPVCIAATSTPINGFRPVVVGASYFETLVPNNQGADGIRTFPARELAGVFARRVLSSEDPDRIATTQLGRRIGFRCVGRRGTSPDPGTIPPFEDRLTLRIRP